MASAPIRDPLADHFITRQNAAFLFIDYQASQLATIRSMDSTLLLKNAVSTVTTIKAAIAGTSPEAHRPQRPPVEQREQQQSYASSR